MSSLRHSALSVWTDQVLPTLPTLAVEAAVRSERFA
jgi:hypothetical protein